MTVVSWSFIFLCLMIIVMKTFVPVILFVLISFIVGYISMLLQQEALLNWYPSLDKSSLTPSGYVFSIVWGVLYLLMGLSAGIIWSMHSTYSWVLTLLFVVQLVFNLLWSLCFFYFESPVLGFAVLIVLFMFVMLYVAGCYTQNKFAAIINIPYLLWLLFAGYLNAYVAMNN